MAAWTDFAENKIIDAVFRGQALSAPATLYFALATSADSDSAGGTEVSGGSYARVAVTASLANCAGTQAAGSTAASSGTSGTTSNNIQISFPAPTANWGLITHMSVYDAPTGGNRWCHAPLTTSKTVNNGDAAPNFPIAAWTFQVDN